jgi:hypothetical protein
MASHLNEKQNAAALSALKRLLTPTNRGGYGFNQVSLSEAFQKKGIAWAQPTISSFKNGRQGGTTAEVAIELLRMVGEDPGPVFGATFTQLPPEATDDPAMGNELSRGQLDAMRMIDWEEYSVEPSQLRVLNEELAADRFALGGDAVPEYWLPRILRRLNEMVGRAPKLPSREPDGEVDTDTESAEKRSAKKALAKGKKR